MLRAGTWSTNCPWTAYNLGDLKLHSCCCCCCCKSLQSCPTLCDPIDGSPPGSSIRGIFQARVLEWGAIAFSRSCTDKLLNLNLQGLLLSSLREAFSVYIQHGREFLSDKGSLQGKTHEKNKKKPQTHQEQRTTRELSMEEEFWPFRLRRLGANVQHQGWNHQLLMAEPSISHSHTAQHSESAKPIITSLRPIITSHHQRN